MFVILTGTGTLRYGEDRFPLREGDVVAAPPGTGKALQIVNDSDSELSYLAISTMEQSEVAEYPDSDKIGVIAGAAPGRHPYELFFFTNASPALTISKASPEHVRRGVCKPGRRRPNPQAPHPQT